MRLGLRSQQRSKHQHWVPQFYLRYFATPSTRNSKTPQIWMFSKNPADGDETLTSVRNVCGSRYLYSPKAASGTRDWGVDDQIGRVEALLGQVWPDLATGYVDLGNEDMRKALSLFISVMHLRHPDVHREVEEVHARLVEFYESGPLQADGTPAVDSFAVDGRTYQLDTSDWHEYRGASADDHHRFFVSLIRSEAGRMAKHLLNKRWSVVFSDADTFITTDKPVVLSHQARARFGYSTPDSIITFPLSPTRLLVLDDLHAEPSNQYYPLQSTSAGAFNLILWQGAVRFLLTGRQVGEVLSEVCALDRSANDA